MTPACKTCAHSLARPSMLRGGSVLWVRALADVGGEGVRGLAQGTRERRRMKVERIGDATLYCGECAEVMAAHQWSIGAVFTDPPFGIGFKYATHIDTPNGYAEWLWQRIEAAERMCAPGSPVMVWQSGTHLRQIAEWFPREWRLLVAAKNFVQMRPTAMQWAFDPVVCWWTPGAKPYAAGTASRDWFIANTAPVVSRPENIEKGHPCPRPLDAMAHMVEQWAAPGASVLDPFMGSGTTGVACVSLGRSFVGIEIDPAYFDIACRRIEQAQRQMTIQPPRMEQEPLL